MAEAVVTVKFSPGELRTVRAALDYYVERWGEAVKAMSPRDGQATKAQIARAADIAGKL